MAHFALWKIVAFGCALQGAALLRVDATGRQTRQDIIFDDSDDDSAATLVHDDALGQASTEDTGVTDQFGRNEVDEIAPEKSQENQLSQRASAVVSEVQESTAVEQGKPVGPPADVSREAAMVESRSMVLIHAPIAESKPPTSVPAIPAASSLASIHQGLSQKPDQTKAFDASGQVLEEYDDAAVEGDVEGKVSDDEHMALKDKEPRTYDDVRRLATGDVDRIVKGSPRKRPGIPSLPSIPQVAVQAPKLKSLVHQGSRLKVAAKRESPQDRMKAQCNAYGSYLAAQLVKGPALIRLWKGTCDGAVKAGAASPQYTLMCNALGSAVETEAIKGAPNMGAICDKVLRVFNEAGIGQFF